MENVYEDRFMATVKVGPKGQIVVPKEVRDMFGIRPGTSLVLLAAKDQGIALQPIEYAVELWNGIQRMIGGKDD